MSLAVEKGADLIIIYNPFRPFLNTNRYQLTPTARGLSELGIGTVLNQAIRTMVQSRLHLGLEKLRMDNNFKGDVILLEPTENDAEFFKLNPLAFGTGMWRLVLGLTRWRDLEQTIRKFPGYCGL